MVYRWMVFFVWIMPLTVQVYGAEIAPVVAYDDPIDIEHGHDIENKIVSEQFGAETRPT